MTSIPMICKKCGNPLGVFDGDVCERCEKGERMSRPPMKALEQIKRYCEKTQCRRCEFGEIDLLSDDDYVGCKLQQTVPCDWEIGERRKNDYL